MPGSFIGARLNTAFGMKTTLLPSGLLGLGLNSLYFVLYHGFIKGTEATSGKEQNLCVVNVNYEEEKTTDTDEDTSV